MKQYDKVILIQDIKEYKKGTKGIIVEIFDNRLAYLEISDEDDDTIGMLYDVPLSILERVE